MNKYIGAFFIVIIVALGAVFAILTPLLKPSSQTSNDPFRENLNTINELRVLELNWSLSALSAYNDQQSNFDRVSGFLPRYRQLKDQLNNQDLSSVDSITEINNKQSQFLLLLQGKEAAIEQFKSSFSIMRNSLKYLPLAAREFERVSGAEDAERLLVDEIKRYYDELNTFLNVPTESGQRKLLVALEALEARSISLPVETANILANFTSHARVVLNRKINFDDTLSSLADPNIIAAGEELAQLYQIRIGSSYSQSLVEQTKIHQQSALLFALLMATALLACLASWIGYRKQLSKHKEELESQAKYHESLKDRSIDKELRGNLESMGDMASMVAHEINTPLGYIDSNMQLLNGGISDIKLFMDEFSVLEDDLEKNQDSEYVANRVNSFLSLANGIKETTVLSELTEVTDDITKGVKQIQHVVDDLKDITRKDSLKTDEYDIAECISGALKMSLVSSVKDVNIIKNIGSLPLLYGSPAEINQVVINLVNNSIYALKGEENKEKAIKIKAVHDGDYVVVSVIDNGPGFDYETKEKIFNPFFTTKDVGEGTGLGLSIVQRIIKRHNGKILVKSVLKKGTNITFMLPVQRAQP